MRRHHPRAIVILLAAALLTASWAALSRADHHLSEEGFISLFNGEDLAGWEGLDAYWSVRDGAITGRTTPDNLLDFNSFLIWTGGEVGDFELRFSYRIVGGNSGVQYRSRVIDEQKYIVSGYQADIDSSPRYSGMCYEEKGRAFLAERGQKVEITPDGERQLIGTFGDKDALQSRIRDEDWNDYTVIARGNTLTHLINGHTMAQVIDNQTDQRAMRGIIALQIHQGPPMTVQYKDIRLRHLD